MNWFSWIAQEQALSDTVGTVRAQNLPPLEQDRLVADLFFPRRDVPSMNLNQTNLVEFRPAADRREWNARGRLIHTPTPVKEEMQFIPIESYFTVEEQEINQLMQQTNANQQAMREILGVTIPARTDALARANQRRQEFDSLQAWWDGTITVVNPQTGDTYDAAFDHDAARRQTAGTAWDNGAVNAWNEFIDWIQEANDAVPGGVNRVVLRQNTYNAIHADAPQATVGMGLINRVLSRAEFENLLANQLGFVIQFIILENWLHRYTGAGLVNAKRRVWGSGVIAAVPTRTAVGFTGYAPVVRAYEILGIEPTAPIDVRGMSVYTEISSNGRMLTRECQVNSFPVPEEQYIYVMDTLVVSSMTA